MSIYKYYVKTKRQRNYGWLRKTSATNHGCLEEYYEEQILYDVSDFIFGLHTYCTYYLSNTYLFNQDASFSWLAVLSAR